MILRKLTQSETVEMITIIKDRIRVYKEICDISMSLIDSSYEDYKKNFKYSIFYPFTFKPISYKEYVKNLTGGYITEYNAPDYLDNLEFKYIRYGSLWDRKFKLKDELQYKMLYYAVYNSSIASMNSKDENFYYILLTYAEKPFDLNEKELLEFRTMKNNYLQLKQVLEEYKDATVQSN